MYKYKDVTNLKIRFLFF